MKKIYRQNEMEVEKNNTTVEDVSKESLKSLVENQVEVLEDIVLESPELNPEKSLPMNPDASIDERFVEKAELNSEKKLAQATGEDLAENGNEILVVITNEKSVAKTDENIEKAEDLVGTIIDDAEQLNKSGGIAEDDDNLLENQSVEIGVTPVDQKRTGEGESAEEPSKNSKSDRKKEVEIIIKKLDDEEELDKYSSDEIEEENLPSEGEEKKTAEDGDSDGSSSEDESSDDESSDGESSNGEEDEVTKTVDVNDDLDEGEDGPIKSKNEQEEVAPVLPSDFKIDPGAAIELIGEVYVSSEGSLIIKAYNSAEYRVLKEKSVLCFADRKPIGYVCEVFGPLKCPYYRVKISSESSNEYSKGTQVYYVVQGAEFELTERIKIIKGCDASNGNDEEVAENELEFSDDAAEAEHKKSKKRKRKRKQDGEDGDTAEGYKRFNSTQHATVKPKPYSGPFMARQEPRPSESRKTMPYMAVQNNEYSQGQYTPLSKSQYTPLSGGQYEPVSNGQQNMQSAYGGGQHVGVGQTKQPENFYVQDNGAQYGQHGQQRHFGQQNQYGRQSDQGHYGQQDLQGLYGQYSQHGLQGQYSQHGLQGLHSQQNQYRQQGQYNQFNGNNNQYSEPTNHYPGSNQHFGPNVSQQHFNQNAGYSGTANTGQFAQAASYNPSLQAQLSQLPPEQVSQLASLVLAAIQYKNSQNNP